MARIYDWDDYSEEDDDEYYEKRARDRGRANDKRNKSKERQESVWEWEKGNKAE